MERGMSYTIFKRGIVQGEASGGEYVQGKCPDPNSSVGGKAPPTSTPAQYGRVTDSE